VHPGVLNLDHANYPHYNIHFHDGTKAATIIKPLQEPIGVRD